KNGAEIVINYTSTQSTINVTEMANPGNLGDPAGTGWHLAGVPTTITYSQFLTPYLTVFVNQFGNFTNGRPSGTVWSVKMSVLPNVLAGGLIKLGSQLVVVQGDGNYSGGADIQEGVLLDQNPTGLGTGGTVTVESGAT